MKAKTIIFYVAIALLPTLCSCNSNGQANNNSDKQTTDSVVQQQPREAKLTFVGDFLFEAPFFAAVDNGYDKNSYFKLVKKYFEDDDLSVGNMEVVIGNDGMKVSAIAQDLSLPYKQVENRLGQARKAVRQQLRCCV